MAEGILNPIPQLEADFDFDVYTKQEVDTLLDGKADKVDTYTKTETDALLNEKADVATTYTKTETNDLLNEKAEKSTTLAGYGITDAYTKAQTDNLLNGKADTNSVYTKEETDNLLSVKANSADVYTKTEANNLLSVKADSVNVYTKTEADTLLAGKADTDDVYTKAQTDTLLSVKANSADVYTKIESNTLLAGKANVDDVYTKTEIDNQLTVTKDGTWVKVAQNTAINLEKLEGGIEYLYGLLSYKYSQLRKYINGNYYDYETDTDSAYTKTVPQGAMPYASLDSVGGKTLVWNQQWTNIMAREATFMGITVTRTNNGLTVTGSLTTANNQWLWAFTPTSGHKYFIGGCPVSGSVKLSCLYSSGYVAQTNGFIISPTASAVYVAIQCSDSQEVINLTWTPMIIDLTLLYGAGNEPTTVEEFTAQFPAQYYAFTQGTLLSAGVTEVVSQGKNLFPATLPSNTINAIVNSNTGVITASSSPRVFAIECEMYTDYYFSQKVTGLGWSISFSNKLPAIGDTVTYKGAMTNRLGYTANSGANRYLIIQTATASVFETLVDTNEAMIEKGSSATAYSPYKAPITYPIPAEIQALEGYGWSAGSVYNYIDYERKVFVKKVVSVTYNGTEDWGKQTDINNPYYYLKVGNNGDVVDHKVVCDSFETVTIAGTNTNVGIDVINSSGYNAARILIRRADMSGSKDDFKTWLASNNITVNYALSTPQEIDISAYLTDDNLIEVEAGGTLTFENQHGDDYRIDVPSQETYMVDLQASL